MFLNESSKFLKEALIFNEENIVYNFDKFESGEINKLLITGYTGSGKSTLAEKLGKKYKVKVVSLDALIENDSEIIKIRKERPRNIGLLFQNRIDEIINSQLNRKERLIIEGVQIFLYDDMEKLKEYSIIINGTSVLFSIIRAYKRNKKADWAREWSNWDIIKDIYENLLYSRLRKFVTEVEKW
jgi:adenylate kinase family enzyme